MLGLLDSDDSDEFKESAVSRSSKASPGMASQSSSSLLEVLGSEEDDEITMPRSSSSRIPIVNRIHTVSSGYSTSVEFGSSHSLEIAKISEQSRTLLEGRAKERSPVLKPNLLRKRVLELDVPVCLKEFLLYYRKF